MPIWRYQGRAGIEPNLWPTDNERIFGETIVEESALDDHQLRLKDGARAKTICATRLVDAKTHLRLEPLTTFINEGDGGIGRGANV